MKINKKISQYFFENNISGKEIAESYGGTVQNVSNILNRESGKVPFEFLEWLAKHHPKLDLNALLREDEKNFVVRESSAHYKLNEDVKKEILNEMSKILDRYL